MRIAKKYEKQVKAYEDFVNRQTGLNRTIQFKRFVTPEERDKLDAFLKFLRQEEAQQLEKKTVKTVKTMTK